MSIDVRVTGSDNVVLTAGHDIINYHLDQRTAEDRRNLLNLLGQVRQTWITDVLENSVREVMLLELGMRTEPGAVAHPWERYIVEAAGEAKRVLPCGIPIGQVFAEAGQMLLILGEPGAGKTTTMLRLARECIERAERDPTAAVPVVLSLSTWATSRKSMHDWLVGELSLRYFVGKSLSRRWLKRRRLLLFLDGLDEVGNERRAACVQALDAYVKRYGVPGMVVCCRYREYAALPVRPGFHEAVFVLPLAQEQIDAYLDAGGFPVQGLRNALNSNDDLRALAESPLMLRIMATVFRGASEGDVRFTPAATREGLRDEVFARYVHHMLVLRERVEDGFSPARVESSLRWLASKMKLLGESVFAVNLLQPAWLTRGQLLAYAFLSRVLVGLVVGFGLWLVACLVITPERFAKSTWPYETVHLSVTTVGIFYGAHAVLAGLCYMPIEYFRLRFSRDKHRRLPFQIMRRTVGFFVYFLVSAGAAMLLIMAAVSLRIPGVYSIDPKQQFFNASLLGSYASFLGTFFALGFGVKMGRGHAKSDIGPIGFLRWEWRTAVRSGVLCGLFAIPFPGVTVGGGFVVGFLFGGYRYAVPPAETRAFSVLSSVTNGMKGAMYVCMTGWFAMLVVYAPPTTLWTWPRMLRITLLEMAFLGIPAFLWFAGVDLLLRGALFVVLWASDMIPFRLRGFLDYAVHLGFLQRAGGGYLFTHRLLLEHFAAEER